MPIMEEELTIHDRREHFSQLLQSPFRRRMFGDIEMYKTSGSDLESNEYIKDTEEAGRHGNEEVASYNIMRMILRLGACPTGVDSNARSSGRRFDAS